MGAKDHLTDSLELISDPKLAKLLGFSLRTFSRWDNPPLAPKIARKSPRCSRER